MSYEVSEAVGCSLLLLSAFVGVIAGGVTACVHGDVVLVASIATLLCYTLCCAAEYWWIKHAR